MSGTYFGLIGESTDEYQTSRIVEALARVSFGGGLYHQIRSKDLLLARADEQPFNHRFHSNIVGMPNNMEAFREFLSATLQWWRDVIGTYVTCDNETMYLFRGSERASSLHVVDMRPQLGQVYFFQTTEMWRCAIGESKVNVPPDQVIIEFPARQLWILRPGKEWLIRKFRIVINAPDQEPWGEGVPLTTDDIAAWLREVGDPGKKIKFNREGGFSEN